MRIWGLGLSRTNIKRRGDSIMKDCMKEKAYPKYDDSRSGNKVGWLYYTSKDKALEASGVAKHNAEIRWAEGFDFGYQSPGSIREVDGRFEVCIP
jgi:hypothetical protein